MITARQARENMPKYDIDKIANECLPKIEAAIVEASVAGKTKIRFTHIINSVEANEWVRQYVNERNRKKTPLIKIITIMEENGFKCYEYYSKQQLVDIDVIFSWGIHDR